MLRQVAGHWVTGWGWIAEQPAVSSQQPAVSSHLSAAAAAAGAAAAAPPAPAPARMVVEAFESGSMMTHIAHSRKLVTIAAFDGCVRRKYAAPAFDRSLGYRLGLDCRSGRWPVTGLQVGVGLPLRQVAGRWVTSWDFNNVEASY